MRNARRGRRSTAATPRRYPRSVRVNEILREVLADSLERLVDTDERLAMLTITGVDCDPDLRRALVLFSSLDDDEQAALADMRIRLQAAISREVRLKRTPLLRFGADPAVAAGGRIEDIIRDLPPPAADPPASDPPASEGPGPES
ncbi:MAG TPA: ribosome-binding factor A [Acidimicrobiales bacterium]|jgi:ribosome-binding factor A